MRRFLVSSSWQARYASGFGNGVINVDTGMPTMQHIADFKRDLRPNIPHPSAEIVILTVSEVSPHGPVVF